MIFVVYFFYLIVSYFYVFYGLWEEMEINRFLKFSVFKGYIWILQYYFFLQVFISFNFFLRQRSRQRVDEVNVFFYFWIYIQDFFVIIRLYIFKIVLGALFLLLLIFIKVITRCMDLFVLIIFLLLLFFDNIVVMIILVLSQ